MSGSHVIHFFQDWSEKQLTQRKRDNVQAHLASCDACAGYYRRMSELMGSLRPDAVPVLVPDPHLPERVTASLPRQDMRRGWLRASFAGVVLVLGIAFGVYVGYGAGTALTSGAPSTENERLLIMSDYYDAWTQAGFAEGWREWGGEPQ